MIKTIQQSTRMVLSPEEKMVKDSWKPVWPRMRLQEYRTGSFWLIFGEWFGLGHSSRRRKVVYLDYLSPLDLPVRLRGIHFSDGTSLGIWIQKMTRDEIVRRMLKRNLGYSAVISEALESGEEEFRV